MPVRVCCYLLTVCAAAWTCQPAFGQTAVDFRDAVRSLEPSLLTVVVSPRDQVVAENDGQADDDQDPAGGARIEVFDLNGRPLRGLGNRAAMGQIAPREDITSAAYAIDDSTLIAYIGGPADTVAVINPSGDETKGKVLAVDYVTGLGAIRVPDAMYPSLILTAGSVEPGMPVLAGWLENNDLILDSGMVSSRPISSRSGVGATPRIDFGGSQPITGAPVIDATGVVVGTMVPGRDGRLVCATAGNIARLIDQAVSDNPSDLKRGLVGVQFEGGGPLVMEVSPDSGAAEAGVKAGDLVSQVGELKVRNAADVIAAVAMARAGDTLEVTVKRDGDMITIPVQLKEHPQQQLIARTTNPQGQGLAMQRAFELRDGQLVPMDVDRAPMQELFNQFQIPMPALPFPGGGPVEGFRVERSNVEKTLQELQRQMEKLNEKLEQQR